jgi:hypothetical protein
MANGLTYINGNAYSYSANGEEAGEFQITGAAATSYASYYNPVSVVSAGSFETFCLETGVNVNLGGSYYAGLSQTTAGIGTGSGLALSLGAAWLYQQFALGDLTTANHDYYDYANNQAGVNSRNADAGMLQAAIWALQGGQSVSGWPGPLSSNPYYQEAITHFGSLTSADAAENGSLGVSVLVLTNCSGNGISQNQLVYTGTPTTNGTPTPDGGTTATLLGMSLGGLSLFGLRRKALAKVSA